MSKILIGIVLSALLVAGPVAAAKPPPSHPPSPTADESPNEPREKAGAAPNRALGLDQPGANVKSAILPLNASRAPAPLVPNISPSAAATGGAARQLAEPRHTKAIVSPGLATCLKHLQTYPEQNRRSNNSWGAVLTDIARHLPADHRYQDAFLRYTQQGDLVTAGHEWTHFLNEHLAFASGSGVSSYYVLDNRYITLTDPQGLRGVVPSVPLSLRGDLYDLYFVQNSGNARVDPLYLFDEWAAYVNDVTVAVDQLDEGKPLNPFDQRAAQTKTAGNALEFVFYGFSVGMAVKQHDPAYYASGEGKKLRDFITWNAQRSMETYQKALKRNELSRGDSRHATLTSNFRCAADAAGMRAWVKSDLGEDLAILFIVPNGSPAFDKRSTSTGIDTPRSTYRARKT